MGVAPTVGEGEGGVDGDGATLAVGDDSATGADEGLRDVTVRTATATPPTSTTAIAAHAAVLR
jgi:hypothetical protein